MPDRDAVPSGATSSAALDTAQSSSAPSPATSSAGGPAADIASWGDVLEIAEGGLSIAFPTERFQDTEQLLSDEAVAAGGTSVSWVGSASGFSFRATVFPDTPTAGVLPSSRTLLNGYLAAEEAYGSPLGTPSFIEVAGFPAIRTPVGADRFLLAMARGDDFLVLTVEPDGSAPATTGLDAVAEAWMATVRIDGPPEAVPADWTGVDMGDPVVATAFLPTGAPPAECFPGVVPGSELCVTKVEIPGGQIGALVTGGPAVEAELATDPGSVIEGVLLALSFDTAPARIQDFQGITRIDADNAVTVGTDRITLLTDGTEIVAVLTTLPVDSDPAIHDQAVRLLSW